MEYINVKCISSDTENTRYLLSKLGNKNLIIIGFNPSSANEKHSDKTMDRALEIASYNGYDGFIMLNVYPLRSTKPKFLPNECDQTICSKNLQLIKDTLESFPNTDVLLAYGNLIYEKPYGIRIKEDIVNILRQSNRNIFCIEKLLTGNPRHPLYSSISTRLKPFKI